MKARRPHSLRCFLLLAVIINENGDVDDNRGDAGAHDEEDRDDCR